MLLHQKLIGIALCAFNSAMLAGCATGMPTEPPPARCLRPATPLGDIKPGDDLVPKYAELRRDKAEDAAKLRCTQAWVKAVLGK